MSNSGPLVFHVWGARGSIFAGGPDKVAFGGDTTCFSVATETGLTIIDAGSGLNAMGEAMARDGAGGATPDAPDSLTEIDLLLTHLHFDHICGLPFFEPVFSDTTILRIWSARFDRDEVFRETLQRALSPPIFPDFRHWDRVRLCTAQPGISIPLAMGGTAMPFALRHPDGAFGWRIDSGGKSVTVVADHEIGDRATDARITDIARDTDLLVLDAMYTDDEIAHRAGWGHSTWRQGLSLGRAAGARHLMMTHHDPHRTDADLDTMERAARAEDPDITFARSGMTRSL